MKLSVLSQNFKRVKNKTHAAIIVTLLDSNGNGIEGTTKIFKGVAKCCPEDTYDFNIGKKIALARAELKAYNNFDKICIKVIEHSEKELKELNEFREKLWNQYKHNDSYISKLVSGGNS